MQGGSAAVAGQGGRQGRLGGRERSPRACGLTSKAMLAAASSVEDRLATGAHRSTAERHQRNIRRPTSALVVERQELICALGGARLRDALHATELRDRHQPPAGHPQHSQAHARPLGLPTCALIEQQVTSRSMRRTSARTPCRSRPCPYGSPAPAPATATASMRSHRSTATPAPAPIGAAPPPSPRRCPAASFPLPPAACHCQAGSGQWPAVDDLMLPMLDGESPKSHWRFFCGVTEAGMAVGTVRPVELYIFCPWSGLTYS